MSASNSEIQQLIYRRVMTNYAQLALVSSYVRRKAIVSEMQLRWTRGAILGSVGYWALLFVNISFCGFKTRSLHINDESC